MTTRKLLPVMSNEEFRERIKKLCLGPSWIRPANPILTRKPTDKGFNPPTQEATK